MTEENEIKELFLNTKPVELLMQLSKPNARHYASALSKDVDVTYSHTVKCIQEMEEMDLVDFEKKGRKKIINLTDMGEELADEFSDLKSSVKSEGQSGMGGSSENSIY